jgi:hypothetical protein
MYRNVLHGLIVLLVLSLLGGCGSGSSDPDDDDTNDTPTVVPTPDETNQESPLSYKGLQFYYDNLSPSQYRLNQLTDSEFNALSSSRRLAVADKLLNSLFFGYPLPELKAKINQGNFLTALRAGLDGDTTDKGWLEEYILDDTVFRQYERVWYQPQVITILTRFYAMRKLDRYYLHNWIAYILTQTILFSPAYELTSTHTPNISGVYNRLVTMLETRSGMRFITYVHMSSEDNWRRFRSPEDNGREMLEIYLMDARDSLVPLAGKALQNWKLNTDSDTLEVGLNRNTVPLSLFGTTVYTGDDFYRELAKSAAFAPGVTRRLVDFFFPDRSSAKRAQITDQIVSSHPETWQDILLQILFSEEYLLHNARAQSAEETFYSLCRKTHYRNRRDTFRRFKDRLVEMHQASMKYKLGKLERVPLDTLSFAHYHQYIREEILLRHANPDQTNPNRWDYHGWQDDFIGLDRFAHDAEDPAGTLRHFVDYLFESLLMRKADDGEQALFASHMLRVNGEGQQVFKYEFDIFTVHNDPDEQDRRRRRHRRDIAIIVLDYLSRLAETYTQSEVH